MTDKKYLLSLFMCALSVCSFAGIFEPMAYGINTGQSEINIMGGVSYFKSTQDYLGSKIDFGGSGAAFGMTALRYITPYLAAGVDVSYTDNGKGGSVIISSNKYNGQAEHGNGMFYAKAQLTPQSPLRLYVPVGIGVDFLKTSLLQSGAETQTDNSAGISLMFGLGLEVETGPYSFIGVEGRYTYNNYFGGNAFGVKDVFYPSILFKAGMRFDGDIFL